MRLLVLPLIALHLLLVPAAQCDAPDELLAQAQALWQKGEKARAVEVITKAIAADPKDLRGYLLRGRMHEALRQHEAAVADFDKCLELDSKFAEAYNHRGSEQFIRGKIAESLADFDRFLALRPQERPGHWKRGITLYYAGKFDEGRKQFEGYEKVDTNDVENAVWHFLCVARAEGVEKARKSILKIGKDARVPMMKVYDLYRGVAKPEEVLTAARDAKLTPEQLNRAHFYAHLYLGLYYEVTGDKKRALEHLNEAVQKHRIDHYMWDVACVGREVLAGGAEKSR
jgi:lipoprotein NlpI